MTKPKQTAAARRSPTKKPASTKKTAGAQAAKKPAVKPAKKSVATRAPKKPSPAKNTTAVTSVKAKPVKSARSVAAAPAATPPAVSPVILSSHLRALRGRLSRVAYTPRFQFLFAAGAVAVLAATTVFWSLLAARLHQQNADQVVDAFLFQNPATFQAAGFPGAHTFLLKWPLFAAMSLLGYTPATYELMTVLMALATVGFLAYVLYRIERRPAVFGVLCLALSSVLLLVPAQPYPGALLPMNLGMTTTRNLEYIVFIGAVLVAARLHHLRPKGFLLLSGLLALLVASDKLFAVLALGAGMFALAHYVLMRWRREAVVSGHWLLASVVSIVLSSIVLLALDRLQVTHIATGLSASPYTPINSLKQLVLGVIYGIGSVLTNFGANPAHGATIVQDIPGAVAAALRRPSIAAYIVNGVLLGLALYGTVRVVLRHRRGQAQDGAWGRATVVLLGASLSALAVFIGTDHYFPVDGRYLTIFLFAFTIGGAVYLRSVRLLPRPVVVAAATLLVVLPIGAATAWQEYRDGAHALAGRSGTTARVSEELQRHRVRKLVGNYWDVTPVKSQGAPAVTIAPTDRCTSPRQVLSSQIWFRPTRQSTAYLAVRDGSPAAGPDFSQAGRNPTYGGCSLARIVSSYGTPSQRIAIGAGGLQSDTPDVLLLLYPDGIGASSARQRAAAAEARPAPFALAGPRPLVPLSERAVCSHGTTLQVVAHQDDDLLFMNPDLQQLVMSGRCLRTVYLTAGDAGESAAYWGSREHGARSAYAALYGVEDVWTDETQMAGDMPVTIAALRDVPQVSLVFMRLPDGNLRGEGFAAHDYESLRRLTAGGITTIRSMSGASYTRQQIQAAILAIMQTDQPDDIRTLAAPQLDDGDHADHHAVGVLTDEAAAGFTQGFTLTHYYGYPSKDMAVNLPDDAIAAKQAVFLAYAKYDGAVCQTVYECQNTLTYGRYLTRQYTVAPSPPDAAEPPADAAAAP